MTVQNLLFCAHTLSHIYWLDPQYGVNKYCVFSGAPGFFTVTAKKANKNLQLTKNFVGFHNLHSPLLTMFTGRISMWAMKSVVMCLFSGKLLRHKRII